MAENVHSAVADVTLELWELCVEARLILFLLSCKCWYHFLVPPVPPQSKKLGGGPVPPVPPPPRFLHPWISVVYCTYTNWNSAAKTFLPSKYEPTGRPDEEKGSGGMLLADPRCFWPLLFEFCEGFGESSENSVRAAKVYREYFIQRLVQP